MENPYQAPNSRIEVPEESVEVLASRGSRLGAAFIDGIILAAVLLPIEFMSGFFQQVMERAQRNETMSLGTIMLWSLIGLVAFVVIQGYPLIQNGQTWGKKACSIRIALLDGRKPGIKQLLARYAVYLLPSRVPGIGALFSLVNICFIFREDRRCIHDLAAGTRVVVA
jgi:uncharacterized RDD family membrane protein YckC